MNENTEQVATSVEQPKKRRYVRKRHNKPKTTENTIEVIGAEQNQVQQTTKTTQNNKNSSKNNTFLLKTIDKCCGECYNFNVKGCGFMSFCEIEQKK